MNNIGLPPACGIAAFTASNHPSMVTFSAASTDACSVICVLPANVPVNKHHSQSYDRDDHPGKSETQPHLLRKDNPYGLRSAAGSTGRCGRKASLCWFVTDRGQGAGVTVTCGRRG